MKRRRLRQCPQGKDLAAYCICLSQVTDRQSWVKRRASHLVKVTKFSFLRVHSQEHSMCGIL